MKQKVWCHVLVVHYEKYSLESCIPCAFKNSQKGPSNAWKSERLSSNLAAARRAISPVSASFLEDMS